MKILITAGPTREFLDPVRFLSNRSTGKMGFAVAEAAAARDHEVTLIAGPVTLKTPANVRRVDVVSACDMLAAVQQHLPEHDALVMTAAVADWRPRRKSEIKLKKASMAPQIELVANPDILKTIQPCKQGRLFVGFAAETGELVGEAQRKLAEKDLDLIVANDVTQPDAGFESDSNRVILVTKNAQPISLPLQSKLDLGRVLIEWLERHAVS